MDRDKMCKLYRGLSIDVSYQVSVHLAKEFQRRRLKCEKLTDDRPQVMAKAHRGNKHFFNCSPINILLFYLKKRSKIDSIV
jgi:hypothetical protein